MMSQAKAGSKRPYLDGPQGVLDIGFSTKRRAGSSGLDTVACTDCHINQDQLNDGQHGNINKSNHEVDGALEHLYLTSVFNTPISPSIFDQRSIISQADDDVFATASICLGVHSIEPETCFGMVSYGSESDLAKNSHV